jgi:hypothetical protein
MNEAHEYHTKLAGLQELIERRRRNHVAAVSGGGDFN